MESAGTLYYNATIITVDPDRSRASALLERNGLIVATGAVEDFGGVNVGRIDLEGATVVPGFNDCHMHILSMGLGLNHVDIAAAAADSIPEIVSRIGDRVSQTPQGGWVLARGYNQNLLAERRHPTRHDLDAVSPDHPAVLWHTSGHVMVASSRALEVAGIGPRTQTPEGGEIDRDADGVPTGVLEETAMHLLRQAIPPPTKDQARDAIIAASKVLASEGITSASDAATGQNMSLSSEADSYIAALASGDLRTRTVLMPLIESVTGEIRLAPADVLKFDQTVASAVGGNTSRCLKVGATKIFTDGALTTRTAAMRHPYVDGSGLGLLTWDQADLLNVARTARDLGWTLAAHAIGDAAVVQVLDVFEALDLAHDARPRIEHASICDLHLINRMRQLNVTAVLQPEDILMLGDAYPAAIGQERAADNSPVSWFEQSGVPIAFSSDRPVTPGHPLTGIQAAVQRRTREGEVLGPDHRVGAETSIGYYTAGGAYATGDEAWKGALRPSMAADFAVLDRDITICAPDEIASAKILRTIVGGQTVFQAS